jgi:hypothetical protein
LECAKYLSFSSPRAFLLTSAAAPRPRISVLESIPFPRHSLRFAKYRAGQNRPGSPICTFRPAAPGGVADHASAAHAIYDHPHHRQHRMGDHPPMANRAVCAGRHGSADAERRWAAAGQDRAGVVYARYCSLGRVRVGSLLDSASCMVMARGGVGGQALRMLQDVHKRLASHRAVSQLS